MTSDNTTGRRGRVLFVFVDGIGLGDEAEHNPLWAVPMPAVRSLLGGPLVASTPRIDRGRLVFRPLDATLGVPGLPQSATGQTALFAGKNGAAELGRHVTAFPGKTLQALIAEGSLFKRARELDRSWVFANARTKRYFELLRQRKLRRGVTAWAVEAAGGAYQDENDLRAGRAVTWDICRDRIELEPPIGVVRPSEAGRHLAALARDFDLVVFETFLTDLAGHGRFALDPADVARRVDGLLEGVLEAKAPEVTLVLTSDHGNFEDLGTKRHTMNAVPLVVVGPGAPAFRGATSLLDVYDGMLRVLD